MSKNKPKPNAVQIGAYTDKARDLIFSGQAIVALAAVAATSPDADDAGEWVMERALGVAFKLLDDAAAMLDPSRVEDLIAGKLRDRVA